MKQQLVSLLAWAVVASVSAIDTQFPSSLDSPAADVLPFPSVQMDAVAQSNKTTPSPAQQKDKNSSQNNNHIQAAIRAGSVPSKGVNLGSWLVSEGWMTKGTELLKDIDEKESSKGEYWTIKAMKDLKTAHERYDKHQSTWITEQDIEAIAKNGLNTVRVPVGWWITGEDKNDVSKKEEQKVHPQHGLDHLDTLIREWAVKHNVAVMISMHAAKGSQNGADHSSPMDSGEANFAVYPENIKSTLDSVATLAARYKNDAAFLGIGLLNEPDKTTSNEVLYKYYRDAYKLIREDGGNDCILSLAPRLTEQNPDVSDEIMHQSSKYKNIWVEWHRYFVWGYQEQSAEFLMTKAMDNFKDDMAKWEANKGQPLFIGEWSFATPGQFKGRDEDFKRFCAKQMEIIKSAKGGYAFWSWRQAGDDEAFNEWSLKSMIRSGLFKA